MKSRKNLLYQNSVVVQNYVTNPLGSSRIRKLYKLVYLSWESQTRKREGRHSGSSSFYQFSPLRVASPTVKIDEMYCQWTLSRNQYFSTCQIRYHIGKLLVKGSLNRRSCLDIIHWHNPSFLNRDSSLPTLFLISPVHLNLCPLSRQNLLIFFTVILEHQKL